MLAVEGPEPVFVLRVLRVQESSSLHEPGKRVGAEQRKAGGEAALEPRLQRMVSARGVIALVADVEELRELTQELLPLHYGAAQRGARRQALEWIRHVRGEAIDQRLIAIRTRGEKARGNRIENVSVDR